MGNVAGEQGLADGALKFGHFDILDMLLHFWYLLSYSP